MATFLWLVFHFSRATDGAENHIAHSNAKLQFQTLLKGAIKNNESDEIFNTHENGFSSTATCSLTFFGTNNYHKNTRIIWLFRD